MSSDQEASLPATSSSLSLPTAEPSPLNYAFLVHSQKTLTQNLPPRVDNKLLARQKRRRTSPEDHAVLEAEYQRNPKPDKVARASIVSRVSLGEKEVQIWFQNRRQNDRRKSKPLQPHELLAPRSSLTDLSTQPASDDHASVEHGSSSGAEQTDLPDRHSLSTSKPWDGEVLHLSSESDIMSRDKEEQHEHPLPSTQTSVATDVLEDTQTSIHEEPARDMNGPSEELLQPAKRKRSASDLRGERANDQQKENTAQSFKSPPSLRLSLSFNGEAMVRKQDELTPSPPKGRNALRIAMSCDGKAVIRSEDEPSPSKNRVAMFSVRRTKLSGLRRSSSAIFPATPRPGLSEKNRVFGRSRDPRNWESFFDTDARCALSTPSSSQNAPIVAASPRLFQSRSQRSLMRSHSARHSLLAPAESITTPVSQSARDKRRKLSRTVSSLGRLETNRNRSFVNSSKANKSLASQSAKPDLELDPGDSDKENWVPGTRSSQVRRRTTASSSSHARRPVLKEANPNLGLGILTHSAKRNRPLHGASAKILPDLSAEVSAFMAGGAGASQEEDLDCVQGLLSLSQGAWR